MFHSARKSMPALDYVSVVRSVYADRRSMLHGALGSAVAAGVAALEAQSWLLCAIAVAFVVIGVVRHFDMAAFDRVPLADDDVDTAAHWEMRATVGGAAIAALYGFWCLASFWLVDDAFAELSSAAVSISVVVGVTARNFSLDRLMSVQVMLIALPLALGLWLTGNPYYIVLSAVFLPFFISLRRISGNVRTILLNAVHGRMEASRLAAELNIALATMPNGLFLLDGEGRIAVVNRSASRLIAGLDLTHAVGRTIKAVASEAHGQGLIATDLRDQLLLAADGERGKRRAVVHGGQDRQFEITINSVDGHTVVMLEDITDRVRASERINFLARYDGLTCLPNRTFFTDTVEAELARLRLKSPRQAVALMMIDLDDFKHVNDTFGHLVGDGLLMEAARRLRDRVEPEGVVARFGGDEFLVFTALDVSRQSMEEQARDILAVLDRPFTVKGHVLTTRASVGILLATAGDELETMFTRADLALYEAKGAGKAQFCVFHEDMDVQYRQRQRLKADLREAIDKHELSLVYQPIVDVRDRAVLGCEALARWQHKALGPISPAVFIPIAEEIGAMADLSRWVLATALRQCATWPSPLKISVNLSVTDFRHTDVADLVRRELDRSGVSPERLEIEITESSLIEEKDVVGKALVELRAMGVGIALDDFGTGYSSLSYLHTLPFTKLKIDRSFVVDVDTNARSLTLLGNIVRLSRDLDMTVTVEGIERESQLAAIVAAADVDHAQGYLFGVPLAGAEISALIGRLAPQPSNMVKSRRKA